MWDVMGYGRLFKRTSTCPTTPIKGEKGLRQIESFVILWYQSLIEGV